MNEEAIKMLGKPGDAMEQEIMDYISAQSDEELEKRIIEKKLTVKACVDFCFKKGKSFEVKRGKEGIAKVSEEQHWKWVREYFGITEDIKPAGKPLPVSVTPHKTSGAKSVIDFDDLL